MVDKSPKYSRFVVLVWISEGFRRFTTVVIVQRGFKMVESTLSAKSTKQTRLWRSSPVAQLTVFVLLIFALAAGTVGFDAYSGRIDLLGPSIDIVSTKTGRIIRVPAGGNVQAAIDQATSGDIVELQAGATYFGEIQLPTKSLTDFVTIRSSAADKFPEEERVGPAAAVLMPKILARGTGRSAITAENGAHHYRFVGIEFTATGDDYVYNLILFGSGEAGDRVPHDLEIDRCYFHPGKNGVVRRGIALNSAITTIKNSYLEGFGFPDEETQGICGWTGTRNVRIINNYVEGGAENIMFGGSDPGSADQIPSDIEVRGNHLNKPRSWVGTASMKTLFELKNAKRVQLIGNLMTNNWVGSALRITVRNQEGNAPFSTVEDVTIRDNVIQNAGDGINILGKDDSHPSETLKNLTIENNLFLNIADGNGFDGSGYLVQIADGVGIAFINNTAFNKGNIVSFYGTTPQNFIFRDNIVGHGNYGIHGLSDLKSPTATAIFQNNIFMNLNGVSSEDYAFPPGNSIVSTISDVGFENPANGDYRLAPRSKFHGKGHGKKDPGSNLQSTVRTF